MNEINKYRMLFVAYKVSICSIKCLCMERAVFMLLYACLDEDDLHFLKLSPISEASYFS